MVQNKAQDKAHRDGSKKGKGKQVQPIVSLSHLVHLLFLFLIPARTEYSLRQRSLFVYILEPKIVPDLHKYLLN